MQCKLYTEIEVSYLENNAYKSCVTLDIGLVSSPKGYTYSWLGSSRTMD